MKVDSEFLAELPEEEFKKVKEKENGKNNRI